MAADAAFRLSNHQRPSKGMIHHGFSRAINDFPAINCAANNLLWQTATPDARAEALHRAQVFELLRQVSPNLKFCPWGAEHAIHSKPTVEKGIQVPDIRVGFEPNRKIRSRINPNFVGVRIQPRQREMYLEKSNYDLQRQLSPTQCLPPLVSRNTFSTSSGSSLLRVDAPPHIPRNIRHRRYSVDLHNYEQPSKKLTNASNNLEQHQKEDNKSKKERTVATKGRKNDDSSKEANSASIDEKETTTKQNAASSGDDDSVVVELNNPKKERDLERKYGQFFCRRCLRGWSSKNVWCVLDTNKVYIKQTCNLCNKVVNPYSVSHLPMFVKRDESKANPITSSSDEKSSA